MSRIHELGEHADNERDRRERRTAATAAIRQLARHGTGTPPDAVIASLQERRDGTQISTTQRESIRNVAGQTNLADDITHASTPLSGRNED